MRIQKRKRSTFSIMMAFAMMILMVFPTMAFAEGEEPPVEEAPAAEEATEEPAVEEAVVEETPAAEESTEEPAVEEAVVEETPSAEEATEEPAVEEPVVEETPTVEETTEEPAAEELVEEEAVADEALEEAEEENLIEIVQALAEADAVLVNENGKEIPLVSEEAAETMAAADPYFYSAGKKYCYVKTAETCTVDCTGGCSNTANPTQTAINAARTALPPDDGTIYVEGGTYKGFNITGFNNDLIIQGAGVGTTTFHSQIAINHNNANILLRNFDVSYDAGSIAIIAFNNTGDLTLEDITVSNKGSTTPIYINNHSGKVALSNITVKGNNSYGMIIRTDNDILLDHVTSNDKHVGAQITTSGSSVEVLHSEFNDNQIVGITIQHDSFHETTMIDVEAVGNNWYGAIFNSPTGGGSYVYNLCNVEVHSTIGQVFTIQGGKSPEQIKVYYDNLTPLAVNNPNVKLIDSPGYCDDPSNCDYDGDGLPDGSDSNPFAFDDADGDGVGDGYEIPGCTDPAATNYNPSATDEDGSCTYPVTPLVVPFSGIILVTGGQLVQLPCNTECVALELPDGSQAEFCGLCGHWASLSEESEETMPFDMPDGTNMLKGMTVVLMDPDKVVLDDVPAGATLKLSHPVTSGVKADALSMYLYDHVKEEWFELTAVEVLDYLEAYAEWPGTSILVE